MVFVPCILKNGECFESWHEILDYILLNSYIKLEVTYLEECLSGENQFFEFKKVRPNVLTMKNDACVRILNKSCFTESLT